MPTQFGKALIIMTKMKMYLHRLQASRTLKTIEITVRFLVSRPIDITQL